MIRNLRTDRKKTQLRIDRYVLFINVYLLVQLIHCNSQLLYIFPLVDVWDTLKKACQKPRYKQYVFIPKHIQYPTH